MIRISRFGIGAVLWLAMTPALFAAAWMGGRGPGNTGSFASTPFPASPAVVWKSFRGAACVGVTPTNTLIADHRVIAAFGTKLLAVSSDTGELCWKQDLSEKPLGDLLLLDNQVIVVCPGGKVSAFKPADGALIWDHTFNNNIMNTPACTDDVITLAISGGSIAVLARKTGKSVASATVGGEIEVAPIQVGKSVLLCFRNGDLVRAEGGQTRWSASLPKGTIRQNPAVSGQLIIVNTEDALYALNSLSNTTPLLWAYKCPGLLGPATVDGKLAYLATAAGQLHAVSMSEGHDIWGDRGITLPAAPLAAPVVIGKILLVRMNFGLIAAYNKETGAPVWSYRLPMAGNAVAGMPAVEDNELYFAASDGAFYHFSGDMPDQDPPTFRQVLPTRAGFDFANSRPLEFVGAIIEDEGSGVQSGSITVTLDQTSLTPRVHYDVKSGYYFVWLTPPKVPSAGMHRLVITAKDQRGNTGAYDTRFYVGNDATSERLTVTINGEYIPKQLKVRPGTIIEWINRTGSPRTVVADDKTFSSDGQFPNGMPQDEHWVWIVPADAQMGMKFFYHCRLRGEAGNGQAPGPGLAGTIEIVDPQRDLPGLPKVTPASLPTFPSPDFLQ